MLEELKTLARLLEYPAVVGEEVQSLPMNRVIGDERPECGRGLSAPTESNIICQGSRGAEAPPTFNDDMDHRFMGTRRDCSGREVLSMLALSFVHRSFHGMRILKEK